MRSFVFSNKRQLFTFAVSVVLSVLFVWLVVHATTFIDTASVSVASSTPGQALAVKGSAIIEGFVSANYFTSTSTNASWLLNSLFGLGTTTPSATLGRGGLAAEGTGLFGNFLYTSFLTATSTTATSSYNGGVILSRSASNVGVGATTSPSGLLSVAGNAFFANYIGIGATGTSTFEGGVNVKANGGLSSASGLTITGGQIQSSGKLVVTDAATSTISNAGFTAGGSSNALVADGSTGNLGVATTSFPAVQNNASASASHKVNVSVGAGTATTTVYFAGGPSVGSAIILKSTDGSGCIAIMATRGSAAIDAAVTLSAKIVACPTP